jgi:hypothetical protein
VVWAEMNDTDRSIRVKRAKILESFMGKIAKNKNEIR